MKPAAPESTTKPPAFEGLFDVVWRMALVALLAGGYLVWSYVLAPAA